MRISTRCPRCGRVELARGDLNLVTMPPRGGEAGRAAGPAPDGAGADAWYVYDCTGCARQVVVGIPPTVVVALVTVGVPVWRVPAEVLERGCPQESPLSVDDVLDAMLWLEVATADDAVAAA